MSANPESFTPAFKQEETKKAAETDASRAEFERVKLQIENSRLYKESFTEKQMLEADKSLKIFTPLVLAEAAKDGSIVYLYRESMKGNVAECRMGNNPGQDKCEITFRRVLRIHPSLGDKLESYTLEVKDAKAELTLTKEDYCIIDGELKTRGTLSLSCKY